MPIPISSGQNTRTLKLQDKIIPWDKLAVWREDRAEMKVVATNGCFDILHAGHVTYLDAARNLGDALIVGVNADATVRDLKGPGRPVSSESDRTLVLAALESVTAVCIFTERTAARFLDRVQPTIYVKGGDLTIDRIPADERAAVEKHGGKIVIAPFVPGRSTSAILEKIARL